ncbi:PTB domain-containing engulfment adapter protein 1 isoform X1 [Callorhinchus milii]|uniref:PTB domain-containing engulfment adapter protein 1 isoform X1 n=1 Tax=Callorhinchus milii TaxID=7868 RepID=UPI0004571EF5|nr:PTB domain-containing engulfment adapter protein 1 isoform X1 [Callorhinchus milii]XP_007908705.1 PTB domain-containing engulfment adapter protein 1 isoform X1 [Callorhinchus milii]XP_042200320.1 PTB domain-containing engulfment adapter protein 1 isoform X1 [Callorhinchus milii]|eukprot:gi/632983553/ref/XP_007908704.1/ PREDICTED: PTB domain-containing engulfment adapter protein 1-like isoform X1 [Callorhinchus milii]
MDAYSQFYSKSSEDYISFSVQFLGCTVVEDPSSSEAVSQAVRVLKLSSLSDSLMLQTRIAKVRGRLPGIKIRNKEKSGAPSVELQVSLHALSVLDSISKEVLYNSPIGLVSSCTLDELDKSLFSYVALEHESGRHMCYVFQGGKHVDEVTETIGEAFSAAHTQMLRAPLAGSDTGRKINYLQKMNRILATENEELKRRVSELEQKLSNNKETTTDFSVQKQANFPLTSPSNPDTQVLSLITRLHGEYYLIRF